MPTILSDVVFRDELRDYMQVNTAERTAFFQSGILTNNNDMSTLLASPTNTFTIPWWVDLDASIESNYSNDVYTDIAVPMTPADATDTVVWESSDPTVATVTSTGQKTAQVTRKKEGSATITGKARSYTGTTAITVTAP